MKKSFLFACMLFVILSANVSGIQVLAADGYASINVDDARAVERTDVIVKKYRFHGNELQYRHWNQTRGEWVEPDWITIS